MIVSFIQKAISFLRRTPYCLKIKESIGLDACTISVGNISFGGAGKTTLVAFIIQRLLAKDKTVTILSRGYKRKSKDTILVPPMGALPSVEDVGDEPYMLKKNLPEASLLVATDRVKEAHGSWNSLQSQYVLLDDGFQYWRAKRDLDVVVLSLAQWKKVGREPMESLTRAHCLVLTHFENIKKEEIERRVRLLAKLPTQMQFPWQRKRIEKVDHSSPYIFFLQHHPLGLFQGHNLSYPVNMLTGKKVILLHGLAFQSSIRASVERLGMEVVEEFSFSDHHWMEEEEAKNICAVFKKKRQALDVEQSSEHDSLILLCTEKDYYRWLEVFTAYKRYFYYLKIEGKFLSPISIKGVVGGESDFLKLIQEVEFASK